MKNNTTAALAIYSDEDLIKKFPGFTNHYVTVNDVKLHYEEKPDQVLEVVLPFLAL
jgi:hypothetical protein